MNPNIISQKLNKLNVYAAKAFFHEKTKYELVGVKIKCNENLTLISYFEIKNIINNMIKNYSANNINSYLLWNTGDMMSFSSSSFNVDCCIIEIREK